MAIFVFVILVLLEVGLCALTVVRQRRKREWRRNRLAAAGIELVVFLCTVLLPGVDLGFRFKGLLFMLILRCAVFGLLFLIKGKKEEGNKRPVGAAASMVWGALLFLLSMIPAFLFTGYAGRETTGAYQTAMGKAILIDQSREEGFETDGSKREVPIYLFYPQNAGQGEQFPLVLFSHGAFGFYASNMSTYMELASHGYVVVSMDHPYHAFVTTDTDGRTITVSPEFMSNVFAVNGEEAAEEEILRLSHEWLALRTEDMDFVIDTLKAAKDEGRLSDCWHLDETDGEEIMGIVNSMDCDKIGVMGHSLGGAASVAIGRERDDISAVIDLDGTMLGEELAYENGAYLFNTELYGTPILSVNSESHQKDSMAAGMDYVNNVVLANAADGQSTYFVGSAHMNFTDLPLFSPALASLLGTGTIDPDRCISLVNEIVLNYMDCYLKGEGNFRVAEAYE